VAWNGLMISGLAIAALALEQPKYLDLASQAASFILNHQWQNDRLHRLNYEGQVQVTAQSEDYAFLIKALLDLQQACLLSGQPTQPWLEAAIKVQTEFDHWLWAIETGGYYNTESRKDLLIRERQWMDQATPAANGVAIANFVRLFLLTENLDYLDRAQQSLDAFSSVMTSSPQGCPSLLVALDWFLRPTLIRARLDVLQYLNRQAFLPTAIYAVEENLPAGAVGLVCQGITCQEPATSFEQLVQQARQSLA
jgi:uncharacterized protein